MRTPSAFRRRDARRGRVLVECCVSIVLLAGGGSLLLLMSTTTARLVDTARQEDVVLTATVNGLAPLYATPCVIATGTRHERPGSRTVIAIHAEARDAVRDLRIEAWWQPSVLAGNGARRHDVMSVARCE